MLRDDRGSDRRSGGYRGRCGARYRRDRRKPLPTIGQASYRSRSSQALSPPSLDILDQIAIDFPAAVAVERGESFVDLGLKLDPSRPVVAAQLLDLLGTRGGVRREMFLKHLLKQRLGGCPALVFANKRTDVVAR